MLFGSKKPKSWAGLYPDHIIVTGPNKSGLRTVVPNSSFTRALNEPEKRCQNRRLPIAIVERKVVSSSPVADKVFHHCFESLYLCLFCTGCDKSESVICMEFSFRNKGLEPIFKKKMNP